MENVTDEDLLIAVRMGARVANLTDRLGIHAKHRPAVTRRMRRLEGAGLVYRDDRYSADNGYFWRVVEPSPC